MKKNIGIIILSIVLILLVVYMGTNLHLQYFSACGTGIAGLGLLAMVVLVLAALVVIIFEWDKKGTQKSFCARCRAPVDGTWEVCPYCGSELMGGRKR